MSGEPSDEPRQVAVAVALGLLSIAFGTPAVIVLMAVAQGRTSEPGRTFDLAVGLVLLAVAVLAAVAAIQAGRRRSGRSLGVAAAVVVGILASYGGVVVSAQTIADTGGDAFEVLRLLVGISLVALCVAIIVRLTRDRSAP